MKAAKLKNQNKKQNTKIVEEQYSLKQLLLIVIILAIIFGIFYVITSLVVKPNKETDKNDNSITELNSSKITLNNLLNRKESEYYVIATMESKYSNLGNTIINYQELYNNYISEYTEKENTLTFYIIDLDDALNKNYVSDSLNIDNNLENLKLNDEVLFKIKDAKIEEYYVGSSNIIDILSNL